jgi:LacI family transcriptional regulator
VPSTHQSQKNVLLALGRYNPKTHKGVARYAGRHRWHLNAEMANFGQLPRSWKGDGIITLLTQQPELVELVKTASVPVVDLSVIREDIPLPRVSGDHYGIGCIAAEHFLQHGFRNFAWFSTVADAVTDLRCRGFSDTLSKVGFNTQRWSFQLPKQKESDEWAAKIDFLQNHLKWIGKPAAILCYWDADAVNVLEACDGMNLHVPEDVTILGTDNNELLCESAWTPLSSINHDLEGLGYAGAALLAESMQLESQIQED